VTTFALDSSAVVTWVLQEPAWQAVQALLDRPGADPVLPAVALTEVVSVARRKGNSSSGQQILAALTSYGARVEHPTDGDLLRAAELLESSASQSAQTPVGPPLTLSLGDALILAVVERLGCVVVTRDRYWAMFAAEGGTEAKVQTF
jgi:PIN domain nuclease of toxin-antitoxin system